MSVTRFEIINKISNLGGQYDTASTLSSEDQLLVCEAVSESIPIKEIDRRKNDRSNENDVINGISNGGSKHPIKFNITDEKLQLIRELKECKYTTHPPQIAFLLDKLFEEWPSYPNHWLNIAQNYPPRSINRFINWMVKQQITGFKTIVNPAAFLTKIIIKFGVKRKEKLKPPKEVFKKSL